MWLMTSGPTMEHTMYAYDQINQNVSKSKSLGSIEIFITLNYQCNQKQRWPQETMFEMKTILSGIEYVKYMLGISKCVFIFFFPFLPALINTHTLCTQKQLCNQKTSTYAKMQEWLDQMHKTEIKSCNRNNWSWCYNDEQDISPVCPCCMASDKKRYGLNWLASLPQLEPSVCTSWTGTTIIAPAGTVIPPFRFKSTNKENQHGWTMVHKKK